MLVHIFQFYCLNQVIYKIKLPGPAILGEGKPENQNHAIIFTRGEGLQTIDMNQVYFYNKTEHTIIRSGVMPCD